MWPPKNLLFSLGEKEGRHGIAGAFAGACHFIVLIWRAVCFEFSEKYFWGQCSESWFVSVAKAGKRKTDVEETNVKRAG
jgi:hypothetical protein